MWNLAGVFETIRTPSSFTGPKRIEFVFAVWKQSLELQTCKPWILFNLFYMDSRNISSNHFFFPWAAITHFFSAYPVDNEDLSSNCPGDSAADHD